MRSVSASRAHASLQVYLNPLLFYHIVSIAIACMMQYDRQIDATYLQYVLLSIVVYLKLHWRFFFEENAQSVVRMCPCRSRRLIGSQWLCTFLCSQKSDLSADPMLTVIVQPPTAFYDFLIPLCLRRLDEDHFNESLMVCGNWKL